MPTKAILFLFGCSEVNSPWLITSKLANQRGRKVLFTCVVYTNLNCSINQEKCKVYNLLQPFEVSDYNLFAITSITNQKNGQFQFNPLTLVPAVSASDEPWPLLHF